jgi:transposase
MSMRPRALPKIPEQTVVVARAAFRQGALAMRVRDELGEVFCDGAFIDAFGIRGRPGISPGAVGDGHGVAVRREPHRPSGR